MLNVEDKKTSFTRIAPFTGLFDDGQYLKKKKVFFVSFLLLSQIEMMLKMHWSNSKVTWYL